MNDLSRYISADRIDYILLNTETSPSPSVIKKYAEEGQGIVEDDLGNMWHRAHIVRARMRSSHRPEKTKGDKLIRSMVRHDPDLLAKQLLKLLN